MARLDLGASLLLADGESAWVLGAAGIGYAEAMPMHRVTGWWCAGQSVLHSFAYMLRDRRPLRVLSHPP